MTKVWILAVKDRTLQFSPYQKADFADYVASHPKTTYRLTPTKKPVSEPLRAFYFGAVIPEIRSTCDEWKNLSGQQIHDIVKKMLFYFETYNPVTKRTERFGRSVMSDNDWNNTSKAMEFLDKVREYLEGCGHEMPDPEEYKNERDSGRFLI